MLTGNFWQQDRLLGSIELFGCMVVCCLLGFIFFRARHNLRAKAISGNRALGSPPAVRIYIILSLILALGGIATLFVTVTPGLTPFRNHINQNLELGGIVLFFLWPLIAAQIMLGVLAIKNKLLCREPFLLWVFLILGYIIFVNIDKTTIGLVYQ